MIKILGFLKFNKGKNIEKVNFEKALKETEIKNEKFKRKHKNLDSFTSYNSDADISINNDNSEYSDDEIDFTKVIIKLFNCDFLES